MSANHAHLFSQMMKAVPETEDVAVVAHITIDGETATHEFSSADRGEFDQFLHCPADTDERTESEE